ncbi:MAG: hypothetical protein ABTR20_13410 [Candidatus Competibacter sp.]
MSGLTAEQHLQLLESIRQWGCSQDRIQSEQDHQAALAATLKNKCGINEKHFKRVAKAYWADTVDKDRLDAETQLDLFEQSRVFASVSSIDEDSLA